MKNELKNCLTVLQKSFYENQAAHAAKLPELFNFPDNGDYYQQTKGVIFGIQGCLNYVNEFLGRLEKS